MISTRVLPRTNFNPRSPDGERRSDHCRCHYRPEISIHAPRMGSDYAPLICFNVCSIFQSTLPGWGATFQTTVKIPLLHYFNPRSPDGERRANGHGHCLTSTYFNPRSPDGERRMSRRVAARHRAFQSTLPGWGATRRAEGAHVLNHFNPRSPDGERQKAYRNNHPIHYFNPRSPDGERRLAQCVRLIILGFQSTLPGWGATRQFAGLRLPIAYFNPRSPDGERRVQGVSSNA